MKTLVPPVAGVSSEFCEIFKSTFFTEHIHETASVDKTCSGKVSKEKVII